MDDDTSDDDLDDPVDFDLERMKEALKGPFYTLPHGLTREQMREWIISHAWGKPKPLTEDGKASASEILEVLESISKKQED